MNRCYSEIPMGIAIYCWLAGFADACTGLLLLAAPEFTLRLMSIETLPKEPVYLRYIGVFVFTVGLTYWLPAVARWSPRRELVMSVLFITGVVRAAVAGFVAFEVSRGGLEPAWMVVCFTDASFAAVQVWMLKELSGGASD